MAAAVGSVDFHEHKNRTQLFIPTDRISRESSSRRIRALTLMPSNGLRNDEHVNGEGCALSP